MTTAEDLGFATALVRLSHLVQRAFIDVGRSHDLTPQQAQLLCVLAQGETGVGMTELGKLLNLEKSSVTGLVDRVQRRALVERVADSCDRRALKITLTEEGLRLANAAHEGVVEKLEEMAAGLPAEQREAVAMAAWRMLPED
ncbi:MarR family winged helix-turn-helix transcriptional regulator [Amycolatopsis umgeniensis]|uniref:DNA-binding MarR family transcriptional regulator n=1 Tax=Amycolatopsis umgeniensis TaxID=336628 RepID=A0A841BCF0_9PSEU|nr:MarR family transcriptional regulator [Amycolatopsis umgeniensis]MBB5856997.1 DNA-binding MarR family transcriptional regulator [Amycolatopsis umgeniensis]